MAADDGGGGEARRAAADGGRRDGGGCGRDGAARGALSVTVSVTAWGAEATVFAGAGGSSLGQVGLRSGRSFSLGEALFSINTYENKHLWVFARADSPQSALRGVGFSHT